MNSCMEYRKKLPSGLPSSSLLYIQSIISTAVRLIFLKHTYYLVSPPPRAFLQGVSLVSEKSKSLILSFRILYNTFHITTLILRSDSWLFSLPCSFHLNSSALFLHLPRMLFSLLPSMPLILSKNVLSHFLILRARNNYSILESPWPKWYLRRLWKHVSVV